MLSLTCGIQNTTQINLPMKQKQTHRHREHTDGYQGGGGVEVGREFEFSICKLLYTEWINNKALPHSTGNYIHYPVINQNRKKYIDTSVYYIY